MTMFCILSNIHADIPSFAACDVVGPGYKPGDKLPIGDPCTLEW